MLLLHGTGGSGMHWRPVIDQLSQQHEVLIADLPGHGRSGPPASDGPHSPPTYAQQLAQLIAPAHPDGVHVAGNSVGGWTALELAKLGVARSVTAIAPAGLWPRRDPWRCTIQLSSQHRLGRAFGAITPRLMRSAFGRKALLGGTMARPTQIPPDDAIELAKTFANTPGFRPHLAATRRDRFRDGIEIDVPVTVAWGDKERLIPRKARRRDELPTHTHYVELKGCGHLPMWDNPQLVADTIITTAAQPRPLRPRPAPH